MKPHEVKGHNSRALYNFLIDNIEEGFTKAEIFEHVDFHIPESTSEESIFSTAIKEARKAAEEDGLFVPDAVPGNGFRYILTDSPDRVMSAWVTNRRRTLGLERRTSNHGKFIKDRLNQIPEELQPILEQGFKAHDEVVKAKEDNEQFALDVNLAVEKFLARQKEEEAEQSEPVV